MAKQNNELGIIFSKWLDTIENFYDLSLLATIEETAASSPSPTDVEVAYNLLGPWTGTGMKIPDIIPPAPPLSFPSDHGEHFDYPVEWTFVTHSLDLAGGGKVNVIGNIFRKAIATHDTAPEVPPLFRQIYSTSIGVTIEIPNKEKVHYSLPTTTFAALEGGVEISSDPFCKVIGKNSIVGSDNNVFPCHVHFEDSGSTLDGRPAITIDLDCAAANPPFLEGSNGYVGLKDHIPGLSSWYYYSWAQQPTTGSVQIDHDTFKVERGLTWMDHQWGGCTPPLPPVSAPAWSGWSFFALQFDENRSFSISCSHGPIVNGVLPPDLPGFATYVTGKGHAQKSILAEAFLTVTKYIESPDTSASYPCAWEIKVKSVPVTIDGLDVVITATTDLEQQSLWMGGLAEYAEAASTVIAVGSDGGLPVQMKGVGYCESVGFEDPHEVVTRGKTWLKSALATKFREGKA